MKVALVAVGAVGPSFDSWEQLAALLKTGNPYERKATVIPKAQNLPPAERRRVGKTVGMALAVAVQAFEQSSIDPADTQSVFSTSSGDGDNCHALCEALAHAEPMISPTKFTNSVHNAAAGYWSIATGAVKASASLCGFDGSFAVGLLEACVLVCADQEPVVLVSYDVPYPEPLLSVRPVLDAMGVALLLAPLDHPQAGNALAHLTVGSVDTGLAADELSDSALESVRQGIPAARALPVLSALACGQTREVRIQAMGDQTVLIEVQPCQ